jgi:dihydropteroate synthase
MQREAEKKDAAAPLWIVEGGGIRLELGHRTLVMGVLNVTPDSFSDGGRFFSLDRAVEQAETMAAQGADLIDVGGESSRPGSDPVSAEEEIRRVLPVIERIAKRLNLPISIDTYKAEVARRALSSGARIINDISALRHDPEMAVLSAREGVPVILMHMQGTPKTMQIQPTYRSLMDDLAAFFVERMAAAEEAGISRDRLILDPGIGFGKTTEHNLSILRFLPRLSDLHRPILVGPSRKSFIGQVLDLPVEDRLEGTAAAVTAAVLGGASIVRVHDVKAMVRVARMADAIKQGFFHEQ